MLIKTLTIPPISMDTRHMSLEEPLLLPYPINLPVNAAFKMKLTTLFFSIIGLTTSFTQASTTLTDEGVYKNLTEYVQYAAAAACIDTSKGVKVGYLNSSCVGQACINADADEYVVDVVDSLSNAIIMTDTSEAQIIIAFQGSRSFVDYVVDFSFIPVDYEPYAVKNNLATKEFNADDASVHVGFKTATDNFLKNAVDVLKSLKDEYPDYSVLVTGHSLGGALASLTGVELYLMGFEPTVVTYAAPKVFNKDMVEWVDQVFNTDQYLSDLEAGNVHQIPKGTFSRVTHTKDIVPAVPLVVMGYYHAGVDYYITKEDLPQAMSDVEIRGKFSTLYDVTTLGSYAGSVLKDPIDALKNNTVKWYHRKYFTVVSECHLSDEASN
ncbi:unnamed protein product [Ambrosiozyma monospora]|uniref:Unnamed protein product n=1 Tax=Ambrosiozyma monospora TaxID=43982 RepID=A0ACB5STG9_AMBMO|nr:unnamed protein product [Ambrosiozyma monospora]